MLLLSSAIFLQNQIFEKKIVQVYRLSLSNRLDPDLAWRFVGPSLGPNCLQKLPADGTRGQWANDV